MVLGIQTISLFLAIFEAYAGLSVRASDSERDYVDYHETLSELKIKSIPKDLHFSSSGYPMVGTMPILNRKAINAMRVSALEHPYIVSIRRNYVHYLTGTLLTKSVIISVANSIFGVPIDELGVVEGETYNDRGMIMHTVILIIFHERFNPNTLKADLCIMKIFEKARDNYSIKPINGIRKKKYKIQPGTLAFVTGWGRCDNLGMELCLPRSSEYYPDEIMDPMLKTISFELYHSPYCKEYKMFDIEMDRGMLCVGVARSSDTLAVPCMAVPGAPLVEGAYLLGILSWGFGCGHVKDLPLIYTDVRFYHKWIHKTAQTLTQLDNNLFKGLFQATKAEKLTKWLRKTINIDISVENHTHFPEQEMQTLGIDIYIALLEGQKYDIRDYLENKMFLKIKSDLLDEVRDQELHTSQIKDEYEIRSDRVGKSRAQSLVSRVPPIPLNVQNGSLTQR